MLGRKSILALFVVILILSNDLISAPDTLRSSNDCNTSSYFVDPDLVAFASRFSLQSPVNLQAVIIALTGDTGSVRLRVFGVEGGINAPVLENDLAKPITIVKKLKGVERFTVTLQEPLFINSFQFFIGLDSISNGIRVLTSKVVQEPICESNDGGMYYSQMLLRKSGVWAYSRFGFAIEPLVVASKVENPVFMYDSAFVKYQDSLTRCDQRQSSVIPNNYSIACGDVNNDGLIDVLNDGHLYINDKGNCIRDVSSSAGLQGHPKANMFIDLNNDGKLDLLFIGLQDSLLSKAIAYVNKGNCTFEEHQMSFPLIDKPSSFSIGDVNGDFYPDLIVSQRLTPDSSVKSLRLLINDQHDGFNDSTAMLDPSGLRFSSASIVTIVDLDNDGMPDLHISGRDESGKSDVNHFLFKRDNSYREMQCLTSDEANTCSTYLEGNTGAAWADADNDGVIDLLVPRRISFASHKRKSTARSGIYNNTGKPDFQLQERDDSTTIAYAERHSGGCFGDFDNDGLLDCVLTTDCECRYADAYLQKELGKYSLSTFELGLQGLAGNRDLVCTDLHNDGKLDLIAIQDGNMIVLKNIQRTDANYVLVELKPALGSVAVGTMVQVHAGADVYTRAFIAGRGLLMQDPSLQHFGIGNHDRIDSIIVWWPHDIREKYTDITVNSIAHLSQGQSEVSTLSKKSASMEAHPNPFTEQITISYHLESSTNVTLGVYQVSGQLVRMLIDNQRSSAGSHQIIWDGMDQTGQSVPSSTFLLRLKSNESVIVTPITRVR